MTGMQPAPIGPADAVPRRDILTLVALAGGAIGVAGYAWPLIDFMNPSKDVLALASVEVPLESDPARQRDHRRLAGQADFRAASHRG